MTNCKTLTYLICFFVFSFTTVNAETADSTSFSKIGYSTDAPSSNFFEGVNNNLISKVSYTPNLDVAFTTGTMGVGFEAATRFNIGKVGLRVRTGVSFMPHFKVPIRFDIKVGATDPNLSWEEKKQIWKENFQKMSDKLQGFTGMSLQDNQIEVTATPKMNNFKLLVDIFPFKNKKWHLTAGFYYGNSDIAKAEPTAQAMIPCMAVSMYNNLYKKGVSFDPIVSIGGTDVSIDESIAAMLQKYGMMEVNVGDATHDIIATQDVFWDFSEYNLDNTSSDYYNEMHSSLNEYNKIKDDPNATPEEIEAARERALRYHKGDVIVAKDKAYYMTTDEYGTITAHANTNKFKPYIGGGYETPISKDGRTNIAINAGILFWGGFPKVMAHNLLGVDENGNNVYSEVDFTRDLHNVATSIEPYVNFFKSIYVWPNVEFKISYRIF